MTRLFAYLAGKCSQAMGSPWAFLTAVCGVLVWAAFGPSTHYSDTWELVINTATTIITFLMVFLIQNTQNRESRALHLKLDELILAAKRADNRMMEIENLTSEELELLARRHKEALEALNREAEALGEAQAAARVNRPRSGT